MALYVRTLKILFSFSAIFCLSFLVAANAQAEILFEGYYKISQGGVHIGYIVSRFEYNDKKKQFISTSFTKTNDLGNNLTESLKTVSTKDMEPLSYNYTTLIGGKTKAIDAEFNNTKMVATVRADGKKEKIVKTIPKGTFLSNVLVYMILRSKEGLRNETKYEYEAIAEEDADIHKGVTQIKGSEEIKGIKTLKATNEFKNMSFLSNITDVGEIITTQVPAQQMTAELVADPTEAIGKVNHPTSLLKELFGRIPDGLANSLSKNAKIVPTPTPIPGKKKGVPGGKGMHLKSGAKETTEQKPEPKPEGN